MEQHYDYIVSGGGAAGRSLICRLLQSELKAKRILLIDRQQKRENDRTWCFWERKPGFFEEIVYHSWDQLWVHTEPGSRQLYIAPYTYKMIRGIDFYQYTDSQLDRAPQVDRLYADVAQIENTGSGVRVHAGDHIFTADWCFNSIFFGSIDKSSVNYLDQHFRGWFVRSATPVFDPGQATLMDFRTPQCDETRFLYVLPSNAYEALVEIAIFSNHHLAVNEYDHLLKRYLEQHLPQLSDLEIVDREMGNIPMTDHPFNRADGRIIHLGMAGGDTRASSGYTFYNIQTRTAAIVQELQRSGRARVSESAAQKRARFYDQLMLRVLEKHYYPGHELFGQLFARNDPARVLAFLNAETSLLDEIRLTTSLPKRPFLRALWEEATGRVLR